MSRRNLSIIYASNIETIAPSIVYDLRSIPTLIDKLLLNYKTNSINRTN
jgi:hypothetical protein